MHDYPVSLQIKDRLCVVVGGGRVGRRKALGLLEAGARVRLVTGGESAAELPAGIDVRARKFLPDDLKEAFLVFAATDHAETNTRVVQEAHRRGALVNRADDPANGDFTLPARLRRGELTVAVATGGRSPALAAVVRTQLAGQFGPEWATVLELVSALRHKRLTALEKNAYNQSVLRRLLDGGLPGMIADGDRAGIDRLLQTLFGEGFSLAELGVHLPKGQV